MKVFYGFIKNIITPPDFQSPINMILLNLSDQKYMKPEHHAELLTDLHIRVLAEILKGEPFDFIKDKFTPEFKELNYEEIMINQANRLTFDDKGMLIGAYPVSPLPTPHKMTVAGIGTGYAMCAIDALGATHTFDAAVSIESKATDTGQTIDFSITSDDIPDTKFVVSYNTLGYNSLQELVAANAQLATDACPSINFYSDRSSVPDELEVLDFKTALHEAEAIFSKSAIRDHILSSLKN